MSLVYIKLFVDYLDAVEPLSDAERGRLFTSMMQYAKTGEAPQLSGNERFLFPMMRAQIDRDAADIEGLSKTRSDCGRMGGRPKKANASVESKKSKCFFGNQKKQMLFSESKKSNDNRIQTIDNRQQTIDEDEDEIARAGARDPAAAVIAEYCQKINPQPSTVCLSELSGFAAELGDELCLRAIGIAQDARVHDWRYIKSILANWQRSGYKTAADVALAEASRARATDGRGEWDFRDFAGDG